MQISAVIPVFNYAHAVGRAIRSVLDQSYPVYEVIVVDDGSTDDTAAAVKSLVRQFSHRPIRYQWQQNAGPSAARNHGARLAVSPWIAFLDADDYWYPRKLAKQVNFAATVPDAGLLFAGVDHESPDGIRRPAPLPRSGYYTWSELLCENWVYSPTPLVRKPIFESAGGFDESRRHAEDWDCWLRVAEKAPVAGQGDIVASYFDHGGGLHSSDLMKKGSRSVLAAAIARGVEKLRYGDANRALASLLASEGVGAAERMDANTWLSRGRAAVRLDPRQFPRLIRAAAWMAARRQLKA